MSSTYQGGKYLDVFCAQGVDPLSKLKISDNQTVCKEFDSVIKGYVVALSGSPATTRLQLPKSPKKQLRLSNSVLLFQTFIPSGSRIIFEINIADTDSSKRRIQISTLYGRVSTTPLQAKIPLTCIPFDEWVWLAIDVSSIVTCVYPGKHLQYINCVSVCGSGKIRRIATVREPIGGVGELPSSWQPPPSVPPLQLIAFNDLAMDLIATDSVKTKRTSKQMHIAFGEKIAIPTHVLHDKQSRHQYDSRGLKPIPLRPMPIPVTAHEIHITPVTMDTIDSPRSQVTPVVMDTVDSPVTPRTSRSEPALSKSSPIKPIISPVLQYSDHSNDESEGASATPPFRYKSRPHVSIPERKPPVNEDGDGCGSRGANPDDDFLSLNESTTEMEEDESYDWQKYQTLSSSSSNSSIDDHTHEPHPQITIPLAGNSLLASTNGFDTLKKKLEALHDPHEDTLDIEEMGGAHSPVGSISSSIVDEERVELTYDQDLNCFYDPQTGKYYKLTE